LLGVRVARDVAVRLSIGVLAALAQGAINAGLTMARSPPALAFPRHDYACHPRVGRLQ
jgi:hypothetical protein